MPGHDGYWYYRDSFFDRILPAPGRRTIEIGCGEGRVARDLIMHGHTVTALDASPTLVAYARRADPDGEYLLGDAAALPFPDAAFDLAVSYNALMDVADMPAAVKEAARVLVDGGRFCICVTHPLADAGLFADADDDAAFVISGSYFGRRRFEGTVARDGLTMTFRGWCYDLQAYTDSLAQAGFVIEAVREPCPIPNAPQYQRALRIPVFLHLLALKG